MTSPLVVRRNLWAVGAIVAAGIVMALSAIVVVCADADRRQRDIEMRFVSTGVQMRIRDLQMNLNPYLIWDDAVVNVDNRFDADWVEQNLASVARDGVNDAMFVLDAAGRPIHASKVAVGPTSLAAFEPYKGVVAILAAEIRAEEARPDRRKASIGVHRSTVALIAGTPKVVTVALIEPDSDAKITKSAAPLLVAVAPLEDAFVKSLTRRYFLQELRVDRTGDAKPAVALEGMNGSVAALTWTPRRPGTELLTLLLPIMATVALALMVAAWAALRQIGAASHRAAESERQAVALAREAQAANEAKSAFLSNMSHELRTPLTSIVGFAGLLARRLEGLDEEQRRYVSRIVTGSESLLVVVNDVLDYSKLEAEAVELDPTPCRPADLLSDAVLLLTPQAQAKGLDLSVHGLDALPEWVLIDSGRLRQVLLNLVGNAVKFTSEGSVRLIAEPVADGRWRLNVVDTGPGIERAVLPRLFQRFQQADMTTTRRFGGTGLGLAISRALIELMGGRIGVDSTVGVGTRFWVELDLPETEEPQAHSTPSDVANIGRAHVLVVDDAEANRELMTAILTALGLEVTTASDGLCALDAVLTQSFDLILMDVQMPGMDGLDCTRAIRASGGPCADVPIYALTANVDRAQLDACLAAGMDDHLSKPISMPQLTSALAVALSGPPQERGRRKTAPRVA